MHHKLKWRVQGTYDDVGPHPNDNQPAGAIEAVKHKHTAENLKNSRDVDVPMSLELGNSLSRTYIAGWQQADKESEAAKRYEYPTDNRDRVRSVFHS